MNPLKNRNTWSELSAILVIRISLLVLLMLISLLTPNYDAIFYAFTGIAFIITVPYSLWVRNKFTARHFIPLQFWIDMGLITGLIYFTDGIKSDLTMLYPLVILCAGIVGTPRQAIGTTLLCIILYTALMALLALDLITNDPPASITAALASVLPSLLLHILAFFCFGLTSTYISKRCNLVKRHKEDAHQTLETLIGKLPAAILALNPDGQILISNETARNLLNISEEKLNSLNFSDLTTTGKRSIPEDYKNATYLTVQGHDPVPVEYRMMDAHLPATAMQNENEDEQQIPVTLLALNNITSQLELEHQLNRIERITAATQIAGEMAHEIRTPLTAISASVQLLKQYEKTANAADWLPNSPRRTDRAELFDHITTASDRMDNVIQNFVDFAEFSPADLLSIIKLDYDGENQSYIGHLNTLARGLENGQNSNS